MDTSTRPIDAQLLVELFNYGSMHRRWILADMEDYSEHITLIGDQAFDPVAGAIETLRTVTGV